MTRELLAHSSLLGRSSGFFGSCLFLGINLLAELRHIQGFVDAFGDRFNFCSKLLLDFVQGKSVLIRDQVDSYAHVTVTAGPAYSVQVSFRVLGEVKVDDYVDCLDVYPPSEEVRADEVSTKALSKVVEDSVPVLLIHLGVDVEAGIAELGDFLGQ